MSFWESRANVHKNIKLFRQIVGHAKHKKFVCASIFFVQQAIYADLFKY